MNMQKKVIKHIMAAGFVLSLFFSFHETVFGEVTLPEGTVAGLPEKLTVMDSDGHSVSNTGEYFFCVEEMQPNVSYTKDIQLMNLREDQAYHIYFYAEPVSAAGAIDLENDCTAVFSLNGATIYEGLVNGKGNIDISSTPLDLGLYNPGDSAVLKCSVTWNGDSADWNADYGEKVVTPNGTIVLREGENDAYVDGEVTFRWIFYAVADTDYVPPKTGILGESHWYTLILFICGVLILILLCLILRRKRKGTNSCSVKSREENESHG